MERITDEEAIAAARRWGLDIHPDLCRREEAVKTDGDCSSPGNKKPEIVRRPGGRGWVDLGARDAWPSGVGFRGTLKKPIDSLTAKDMKP